MLDSSRIDRAIASGDAARIDAVIRDIDAQLGSSIDSSTAVGLLLNKAVLYERTGRFSEANAHVDLALAQQPGSRDVQFQCAYLKASIAHQQGQVAEAFEQHTSLLHKYADELASEQYRFVYQDIQQQRAIEAAHLLKADEAIPLFHEILNYDLVPEERAVALANVGILYSKRHRYDSAAQYLSEACKMVLDKEWRGHAHFHLAIALTHLGELERAKEELLYCERNSSELGLNLKKIYAWRAAVSEKLGEQLESALYRGLANPL